MACTKDFNYNREAIRRQYFSRVRPFYEQVVSDLALSKAVFLVLCNPSVSELCMT